MHDGLAQAVGRGDEDDLVESGLGVQREQDAGRPEVAADHPLDARGKRHLGLGVALVHAVGDRPVVIQRREDFLNSVKNIIYAADIKERFLLSRK